MTFRTRCFSGLFRLYLVPQRSLRFVGSDRIRIHRVQVVQACQTQNRLRHDAGVGMFEGVRLQTSAIVLKRLVSGGQTMKAFMQYSQPMSRFSTHANGDVDTRRMQRVIEQSSRQQMKGEGDSRLIYEVRTLGMMRFCTLFFYTTAVVGLYMSPDLISSALEHDAINSEMIFSFLSVGIGVVVLPLLLTIFNNRLVLRMYYNEAQRSYIAMTQTPALTLRREEFQLNEVVPTVKNPSSVLQIFQLKSLTAKGRPYFVNPYNFKVPSDYNHLMGYD